MPEQSITGKPQPVTERAKLCTWFNRVVENIWRKAMTGYHSGLSKIPGLGLMILLGFGIVSYAQQKGNGPNPGTNTSDAVYTIQPNDTLEIFVWKEPDLTRKVLVRPDGRISFPLIQDLQAAGSSPDELKNRIEGKLKEYLTSPNVTVIVDNIQSYKVFVVGKVQKPGSILAEKPITVLQALSLAGGFQDYAKQASITILRNSGGQNFVLPFDYREVTRGKKPEENIVLRSGDVVVVP
jgi:polysaccharide biosynthesis/export protein